MTRRILGWIGLLLTMRAAGQPAASRDLVYPNVTVKRNLSYGKAGKPLTFDLYMPAGDAAGSRPLIIWMHGGGFAFGSKRASGIRLWCEDFARKGYYCAAINYRKRGIGPLFHFQKLVAGCYDAVEDTRMAIAYFKRQSNVLHIDTSRIILAGNSAGGMIALQAAYSRPADLRAMAGYPAGPDADTTPVGVAAVINFWGAIFNTQWLANARVPIASVYGDRDKIVIPGRRGSFAGGLVIHQAADSLSIPNTIKVFKGYSHELQRHFNPFFGSGRNVRRRWREAGQFAADYLSAELWHEHS